MIESLISLLAFGLVILAITLVVRAIKKAHYKANQVGEPETKVFGETFVTIIKLKDKDFGEDVIVARIISDEKLSQELMLEIGRTIPDVAEVRFYEQSQFNSKYAYYRKDKDIVYFDD